ncbi:hypothetical protein GCM10022220_47400 [Actinocatenispora rupis]|uniref:Uncharacterized protein n=1 Tax=Actinocatenispora rupis TaxID=519421 RepID=A0A8J3J5T5_9ACTN|nr:hypothetical protein Aru02nite_33710 [Actinocatenispora rupis]
MLGRRGATVAKDLAGPDADVAAGKTTQLPAVALLDTQYRIAVLRSEHAWMTATSARLSAGELARPRRGRRHPGRLRLSGRSGAASRPPRPWRTRATPAPRPASTR